MGTNVWIDDRDRRVRFNGVWPIGGTAREFKETVSSSTRVGDSFVVPFYGQSIVVYGTIDSTSAGVVTNYSIDGRPPVQVTSQAGPGDTLHQQFWMSPVLNITQHELTVTMAKVNPDAEPGEGTIWFDYFIVNDPSGHEGVPPGKGLSKAGIVGAVVGVVALLAVAIVCSILWIRRRRQKQEERQSHLNYDRELGDDGVATWKSGEEGDRDGVAFPSNSNNRQQPSAGRIQPFVLGLSASRNHVSTRPSTGSSNRKSDSRGPSLGTDESTPSESVLSSHASTSTATANAAATVGSQPTQSLHDHSSSTDSGSAVVVPVTRPSKRHRNLREGLSSSSSSASTAGGHSIPATATSTTRGDISERPAVAVATNEPLAEVPIEEEESSSQPEAAPMQHVDSGVRLATTPTLPAELPPVYSPT